jgi:DNA-binding transcriptional ArsR family regulator
MSSSADTDHDIDPVLQALSSTPRRAILSALLRAPSLGPGDLAAVRASVEVTESGFDIAFHHVHLPGLEASGLVTYEPRTDEVERGPRFDAYRPLIEFLEEFGNRTVDPPKRP